MAGNRIKVYWIFLLMLLYTGTLVMSVGQTQARYDDTAVITTVLETDVTGIYSNCMVRAGEPAVTVLLGDLEKNETITVPITIQCVEEGYEGKLLCGVSDPNNQNYEKYLDLFVSPTGQEEAWEEDEEKILSLGGAGKTESIDLTLTIKPTSEATDVAHEMMKINVVVTWGEEMWGTFQVILPKVVEVLKTETPPDSTEALDDSEENENLEEEEDTNENLNPDENIPPEDNSNLDLITDQEEIVELDEPDIFNPETESPTQLKTLSVFALDDTLPVLMEVTNDITSVRLGVWGTEQKVEAFPKGTRLSLDGGKSYYMIYADYAPEFMLEQNAVEEESEEPETVAEKEDLIEPDQNAAENPIQEEDPETQAQTQENEKSADPNPTEGTENPTGQDPTGETVPPTEDDLPAKDDPDETQTTIQTLLLLDFSHAKMNKEQNLLLVMETYSGSIQTDLALAETTTGAITLAANILPVAQTEAVAEEGSQTETWVQPYGKPILNQDHYMELTAPEAWKELDVDLESETDCILEILTMTDDGSLVYQEVSLTEETFLLTYINEDQEEKLEHKLELKLGEKLPQAGTYRLTLNWKYEGVLFKQTQTTFFINYSAYLNRDLSSPEVQTND